MKEKPQKGAKSSKNGKEKEDRQFNVELTSKQLKEQKREEARARAAETRKIVTAGTGQWTGKLPAQLLNEHAQKMKWERVEYPVRSFGKEPEQLWVSSVILARRNPKTKEIEKVRFDPPSERVPKQATQVEARNLAATYGMHRLLSQRNMKMMLPPPHRDLWIELDADKAAAKPHERYKWNEDPWQAAKDRQQFRNEIDLERRQLAEKRERNKLALEAQREAEQHESQSPSEVNQNQLESQHVKQVKFNNTLNMSRKVRSVVERVIRENDGFEFTAKHALVEKDNPEKYKQLSTMLEKLGFHRPFVRESLEYTCTLSTALAWLLIHVPEDDVPKMFMPSDIGLTARVSPNMNIESTTSKLRSFGYSEDVARNVAEETKGSLLASVVKLTANFVHMEPSKKIEKPPEDIWPEELESLLALVDPRSVNATADGTACMITSSKFGFKLHFFKSDSYPNFLPGIAVEVVEGFKGISKVVQLEATRRAAVHAHTYLLGDFMIFLVFQYLEDTFSEILKSPVKLAQISSGVFGVDESVASSNAISGSRSSKNGISKRKAIPIDVQEVLKVRDERMKTEQGRTILEGRASLPAWEQREKIVELVEKNQIVLITGETGSGKSTQTVQFILDAFPSSQIVCTQPRRISAIGVAQRVADERLVNLGDQVGYIIRGEAKASNRTQLKFVTSGVLLRMLQGKMRGEMSTKLGEPDPELLDMDGITHIFVDEVHERSIDGDFLLILIKRLVAKAPNIKIVLMSATVDPQQFFHYFAPLKMGYTHISGRTFPVKQYFLDTVLRKTGYNPINASREEEEGETTEITKADGIGKIMGAIRAKSPGRVDYDLIAATVEYLHNDLTVSGDTQGSILIFMSGAGEIDQALRAISRSSVASNFWALPLHAALPPSDQKKVFQTAPKGLRKIVASTNIAETSITISDIVAVVDTGRVKETIYDSEANVTRLVDTWVSRAAATQRMGRAGRVRAGECYKLYSENAQNTRMSPSLVPEILRSPLEVLYLNVKNMGISNVEKFLSSAIDPPNSSALDAAKQNLISYGALDPINNELTPLGRHISLIPTDPRTGKLLMLGAMMGCLTKCLTVAAILSIGKLPFITAKGDEDGKAQIKADFHAENGDLLAASEAYNRFCRNDVDRKVISRNVCRDIQSTRRQLLSSLIQAGFVDSKVMQGGKEQIPEDLTKYDDDPAIVRSVISAALQPNTVEIVFPQQKYLSTSAGAIKKEGLDNSKKIRFFSPKGERVFVHPCSLLFGATEFLDGARYMTYGSAIMTSKHFITNVTPVSSYGLILFASRISVDPFGNGLIVDKWTGLRCWPRAGVLLQFLQLLFGKLMDAKFRSPNVNIIDHPVIQLVHDLIESEGKTQEVGLLA